MKYILILLIISVFLLVGCQSTNGIIIGQGILVDKTNYFVKLDETIYEISQDAAWEKKYILQVGSCYCLIETKTAFGGKVWSLIPCDKYKNLEAQQ